MMLNTGRVMRKDIHDFLNCPGADGVENWCYLGGAMTSINEELNPKTESTAYVGDESATTDVLGYEVKFPFESDLFKSHEATLWIYDVGREQKVGSNAETDYIRVELFRPVEGRPDTFRARKFRVSVQVSSISGEGTGKIKVSGSFGNVGRFVEGEFNTVARTFALPGQTPAPNPDPSDKPNEEEPSV